MKPKPSKLDPFAERLDEWLAPVDQGGKGLTLQQAREQLKADGCSVALSTLSDWCAARRSRLQEEMMLRQIATGTNVCREVEAEFERSPAPELSTLVKLHRVLILKLSTEGQVDTEKLELVNRMMREVQKYARLEQLAEQGRREDRKISLMEKKAAQADEAEGIMKDKALSETQRAERMRAVFGIA